MFPKDAKTVTQELVGASTATMLPSGSYTILNVSMQQSGTASDTSLLCGSSLIAKNYARDFPTNDMSYNCNDTLVGTKTGNDSSTIVVTYVDYPLASTTDKLSVDQVSSVVGTGFVIFLLTVFLMVYIFRRK